MQQGSPIIELPILHFSELEELSNLNNINVSEILQMDNNNINNNTNNNNFNNNSNNSNNNEENNNVERGEKRKIEETKRIAAACLLCRARKRKCDGLVPCSYCSAKGVACQYIKQKKRGPPKKQLDIPATDQAVATNKTPPRSPSPKSHAHENANASHAGALAHAHAQQIVSARAHAFAANAPLRFEGVLVDQVEAQLYASLYLRYVNAILPVSDVDKIMRPISPAQRVQSFSALAYAARICGDTLRSNTYINQARLTCGEIFDTPSTDAIAGLIMMGNYWQLVLNRDLSAHYSKMAHSLSKILTNKNNLDFKFYMLSYVNSALCEESNDAKAVKLYKLAAEINTTIHSKDDHSSFAPVFASFCTVSGSVIAHLGYNPIIVTSDIDLSQFFQTFDNTFLSEESRVAILKELNSLTIAAMGLQSSAIKSHLDVLLNVLTPMYMSVIEWRSGHITEALHFALNCLQGLKRLESIDVFLYTGGVVDYPHLTMLGGICQLLFTQGQYNLAAQFIEKIRFVCKIMEPEYDFLKKYLDEFLEQIPPEHRNQYSDISPKVSIVELSEELGTDEQTNTNNINNNLNNISITSNISNNMRNNINNINNQLNNNFNNNILPSSNFANMQPNITSNNNNNNNNSTFSNNTKAPDFDSFCDDLFSGITSHN